MSDSELRREVARGRLEVETIAGKQYTTLTAIERMRELCRDRPRTNVVVPERAPGAANMSQAKIPFAWWPVRIAPPFRHRAVCAISNGKKWSMRPGVISMLPMIANLGMSAPGADTEVSAQQRDDLTRRAVIIKSHVRATLRKLRAVMTVRMLLPPFPSLRS
jgi:hypothetical protein